MRDTMAHPMPHCRAHSAAKFFCSGSPVFRTNLSPSHDTLLPCTACKHPPLTRPRPRLHLSSRTTETEAMAKQRRYREKTADLLKLLDRAIQHSKMDLIPSFGFASKGTSFPPFPLPSRPPRTLCAMIPSRPRFVSVAMRENGCGMKGSISTMDRPPRFCLAGTPGLATG